MDFYAPSIKLGIEIDGESHFVDNISIQKDKQRNLDLSEKGKRIIVPFSNGESYEQTAMRIKSFLEDLSKNYDGKKVMITGHRATQYGLEYWINYMLLKEIVIAPWKWQAGWVYELENKKMQ